MKSKTARILCTAGAVISALFSALVVLFPNTMVSLAGDGLVSFVEMLMGGVVSEKNVWIGPLCIVLIYAVPATLCSGLAWLIPEDRRNAPKTAVVYASVLTFFSFVMFLAQDFIGLFGFISTAIGSFGCIGCILLYGRLQKKLPAVFNRETVSYIVFGVLTTIVSFVSQMLFASLGTPSGVNTVGSWICAVTFAYIVNKLFVFESHTDSKQAFWREMGLFFAARLASLGMELVFMIITVDLLHFSEAVCKLIAQVFILIANYVLSKLIIFRKKGE